LKTGFVPSEDKGTLFVFTQLPPSSSIARTDETVKEIYSILSQDKENIKNIIQFTGQDFTTFARRTNAAATIIKLQDWDDRKRPDQQAGVLVGKYFNQLMGVSEGFSFGVVPPPINGMGLAGGFDFYVQSRTGASMSEIESYVKKIMEEASQRPELVGMRTTLNASFPKYKVDVDTQKAIAKGVSIADIYQSMNATFGNYYVNDFNVNGRTYKVNMQAEQSFRKNPDDLHNIYVRSSSGELLALSSFVTLHEMVEADLVERFNLFNAAKVSGMAAPGYSSGQALNAIEEVCQNVLPDGYSIGWIGVAYQEKQISSTSTIAFVFGIIFLYLILSALYERWLMPVSVLMAVPFGIFGAVVATTFRGLENDIYFQVGILVIAGLAAKNAILIVEFAMQKQEQGMKLLDAAIDAAKIRFRPIIMTSLAFILGVSPLVFSSGAGAASRHSIGTGVVGGMLSATFLAILFIPLFFVLISKLKKENR
ncbi:MAG: efflux RND transporter permease subunit, partial [Sulfurimonas sp.]